MDLLHKIGAELFTLSVPILGTLFASLATAAIARFVKQQGIDLTAMQQQQLEALVLRAVTAAEEMARRSPDMSGQAKRNWVSDVVLAQAPNTDRNELQRVIDATLPAVRLALRPSTPATFGR